jgi:hypothetical protein
MKSFILISFTLIALIATKVQSESYSKACFINYFLKLDLLDKSFENLKTNDGKVDQKCEIAVNSTISQLKSSTSDVCVSDYFSKKLFSETLLKEFLIPQLKSRQSEVVFDERFKTFQAKAVNITTVICSNKSTFRPDLKQMMKQGKRQKESKAKELDCLTRYIQLRNKPLDDECKNLVDSIKDQFYTTNEENIRKVFVAPNDNLVNLDCGAEKAKQNQLFEKLFFFVVLAATKNMSERQIDVLLQGADSVIASSSRLIFECMI